MQQPAAMTKRAGGIVQEGHDTQRKVGWELPPLRYKVASMLSCLAGLILAFIAQALGLHRETAEDTSLILSLIGCSVAMFLAWLATGYLLNRRIFCQHSVQAVSHLTHLSAAKYDNAGSFFYTTDIDRVETDPASEMWCWGLMFAPEISNGAVIKVAFAMKCLLLCTSLVLSLIRGAYIESGSMARAWELTVAVASVSGLLMFDGAFAMVFGGERSPCAVLGKFAYRLFYGREIPFEPVHSTVHIAQEAIMTIELSPWGFLIPMVHRYIYDIQVTSTWLLPIMSNFMGISYTIGAIYFKGCTLAFLFGIAVERGFLPKPGAMRHREGITVKGISYSIWGPFVQLEAAHVAKV